MGLLLDTAFGLQFYGLQAQAFRHPVWEFYFFYVFGYED